MLALRAATGKRVAASPAKSPRQGDRTLRRSPAPTRHPPAAAPAWDFGNVTVLAPDHPDSIGRSTAGALQAKLAIGSTNDPLEHEADRVADRVMRMAEPAASVTAAPEQLSRKCAACEEEDAQQLQTKRAGARAPVGEAPAAVHDVLRSPGRPLDAATRAFFEPRFGYDFGRVRVHADPQAAQSARAVNALAYAVGRDVVFDAGRFAPDTPAGRSLLAHELAHVVQQQPGRISRQSPPPAAAQTPADAGAPGADAGAPGGATASTPATAVKGTALGKQLRSVSMAKATTPKVVRQPGSAGTIDITQTDYLTFNAVARFAPSPALSAWTFGFFQLERPFEDYQATLRESGSSDPNKDVNLYLNDSIRAQLPLLDHTKGSVFFQPTGLPQTAKADPKTGEVKLTYKDYPSTPFTTSLEKPAGTFYTLSAISARSFFFTAFGATDGTSTVLLATTLWDFGGCDGFAPPDLAATKVLGNVNVAAVQLCSTGNCNAAEGALFGTTPSKTATEVAATEILGKYKDPDKYNGPANFELACAATATPATGKK